MVEGLWTAVEGFVSRCDGFCGVFGRFLTWSKPGMFFGRSLNLNLLDGLFSGHLQVLLLVF